MVLVDFKVLIMNSSINLDMLESMRYSDLQKLAKSLGIKANMKVNQGL